MAKRKIQGYLSDDDYEKIMSVVIEIQIKSMRITNRKCTIGDAIKEVCIFYANHHGQILKGKANSVKPYYYRNSFFKNVFEKIKKAEKLGINTWNNQIAETVRQDVFRIMEIKNEYAKKNDIEEIRDNTEQWNAIVDYLKGIYGEYQESEKEEDLKSDEENK